MSYTLEQYEALKAAYASGALSVKAREHQVTYRSRAEMAGILREMERELGISASEGSRRRPTFTKGL